MSEETTTKKFEDHFGSVGDKYKAFRPTYPQKIFDIIKEFHGTDAPMDLALDVGCGSGQATLSLAQMFKKVIGVEPSLGQITNAMKADNVTYIQSPSESIAVDENESVDLINVACALHWFDFDAFFKETQRLLKPNGTLVAFSYSLCSLTPNEAAEAINNDLINNILGPYWAERKKVNDNKYADIVPPYKNTVRKEFNIVQKTSIKQLVGVYGTWSGYATFLQSNQDILPSIKNKLMEAYNTTDENTLVDVTVSPNPGGLINHKKYDMVPPTSFFLSTASIGTNRLRKSDTILRAELNLNFESYPLSGSTGSLRNRSASKGATIANPQQITSMLRYEKLSKFFGTSKEQLHIISNLAQDHVPQFLDHSPTSSPGSSPPVSPPSSPTISPILHPLGSWVPGEPPSRKLRSRAATTSSYSDSLSRNTGTSFAGLATPGLTSPTDRDRSRGPKLLIAKILAKTNAVAPNSNGHYSASNSASNSTTSTPRYSPSRHSEMSEHALTTLNVESLSALMRDKTTYDQFKLFCEKEESICNLLFIEEVEQFQQSAINNETTNIQEEVERIYNKFLVVGTPNELSLDRKYQQQVQNSIKQAAEPNSALPLQRTVFDRIHRMIKEDMATDSFKRFCTLHQYQPLHTAPQRTPPTAAVAVPLTSSSWSGLSSSPVNTPSSSPSPSSSPPIHAESHSNFSFNTMGTNNGSPSSPQQSPRGDRPNNSPRPPIPSLSTLPNSSFSNSGIISPPLSPRISMIKPHFLKETMSVGRPGTSPVEHLQTATLEDLQYGVAFGIKRGSCRAPCDCIAYKPEGDNGGACLNCGHYPAIHKNLGKLGAPAEPSNGDDGSSTAPSTPYTTPCAPSPIICGIDSPLPSPKKLALPDLKSKVDSFIFDPKLLINFNNWAIDGDEIVFLNKLGEGTSAKVYKATWRNQEVAVKILKNTPEQQKLLDFLKELEIMSSLRSPHVVYFYGMVIQPKICMIMEYCSNQTLYHLMHTSMDFTWDWVLKFSIEMVKGIKCLHNWKPVIVHRDLKSLNLLVSDNWTIKVADFGLSRFATAKSASIRKTRGTYAYCAPEVFFGDFTVKGDIFSIGIIMWELVIRCMKAKYERPFSEYKHIQYDFQILIQTSKHNLRPTIPPNCPELFTTLITQCWDPTPEKWDKVREKPKKS
eukprot:gene5972-6917_t